MNRRSFAMAAAILMLTACQTVSESDLAPRQFTFDTDKANARDAIVGAFLARGYQLKSDSELTLVFDRPATDDFWTMVAFGSEWNAVPNARVRVTLTGDNPTKAFTDLSVITNPGTGFERPNDMNRDQKGRQAVANTIEQARNTLSQS